MNKPLAFLIVSIIVLITLPVFFITIPILIIIYNSLIRKRNQVDYAFSAIDVMLKKRSDLVPNVVASVNKIMTHEKELFEQITKLRSDIDSQEGDSKERFELENQMSQLLGQINVTMENYPEIKSNENMILLQRTLNETEEQIGASRRMYNAAVVNFNNSIQTFPNNLIATIAEHKQKAYFEATEQERTNPSVKNLFGA